MLNKQVNDVLLDAANVPDRSDLTKAGRALQKHGSRSGSLFPEAQGSIPDVNKQASAIVEGILTEPDSTVTKRHHARFGEVVEIYAPNGQGIRYDALHNFIGFIEKGN